MFMLQKQLNIYWCNIYMLTLYTPLKYYAQYCNGTIEVQMVEYKQNISNIHQQVI